MYVSRGDIDVEELMHVISELHSTSDRAAAIVGGSLVEIALQHALVAVLHRNKKVTDEIFRPTGAVGAFESKIHLGMLTGIYGPLACRDLLTIKNIRNAFAHKVEIRDFTHQCVRDWVANLRLAERYTIDIEDAKDATKSPVINDKTGEPLEPIGAWDWWFGVTNRKTALNNPRERYLLTVQALTYGLSVAHECRMPRPFF